MANRIQPHPNPPYLKGDGTLNVSGQLKLYVAGTSTPKVAYKDAAGTSYGSTIDLNSSGLPEDGPIYWDNEQLYKVEVYTRTDDTPTYALDYTVDNFGENAASSLNRITTATSWTVDKVGATSTTFATLTDAMVSAREWVIMGGGGLTINVNNGTYINDYPDFTHPQGQYISIIGESKAGVIFQNTTGGVNVWSIPRGQDLLRLSTVTLEQTIDHLPALSVDRKASILRFGDIALNFTGATPSYAINMVQGSYIGPLAAGGAETVDVDAFAAAVRCFGGNYSTGETINVTNGVSYGILADEQATMTVGSLVCTGATTGVSAVAQSRVALTSTLSVTSATTGVHAATGGQVYIQDVSPTFTTVTTSYSPTQNERVNQNAATASIENSTFIAQA